MKLGREREGGGAERRRGGGDVPLRTVVKHLVLSASVTDPVRDAAARHHGLSEAPGHR